MTHLYLDPIPHCFVAKKPSFVMSGYPSKTFAFPLKFVSYSIKWVTKFRDKTRVAFENRKFLNSQISDLFFSKKKILFFTRRKKFHLSHRPTVACELPSPHNTEKRPHSSCAWDHSWARAQLTQRLALPTLLLPSRRQPPPSTGMHAGLTDG